MLGALGCDYGQGYLHRQADDRQAGDRRADGLPYASSSGRTAITWLWERAAEDPAAGRQRHAGLDRQPSTAPWPAPIGAARGRRPPGPRPRRAAGARPCAAGRQSRLDEVEPPAAELRTPPPQPSRRKKRRKRNEEAPKRLRRDRRRLTAWRGRRHLAQRRVVLARHARCRRAARRRRCSEASHCAGSRFPAAPAPSRHSPAPDGPLRALPRAMARQDVDGRGQRELPADGQARIGGEIVAGVQHEAAALFHRTAKEHRHVHQFAAGSSRAVLARCRAGRRDRRSSSSASPC